MKVLFIASEVAPFAKVGGLADVASALPRALGGLGHDARVIMPRYGGIDAARFSLERLGESFVVRFGPSEERCSLWQAQLDGVPVYLLDNARYFGSAAVYGYEGDLERFAFFSRAALEAVRVLGWQPDLVHLHDWHTALIAAWLETTLRQDPFFRDIASVMTIHNLAFQGEFDESLRAQFDLVPRELANRTVEGVSLYNALGLGIAHADVVTTVSQTYAREILTPEYGEKLDPLLRAYRDHLYGIPNGIDVDFFNPATDPFIAAHYSAEDPRGKATNKQALQRENNLAVDANVPLIGFVGRIFDQKGVDLIAEALPPLLEELDFQFVLLGTGDPRYHAICRRLAVQYPRRVAVHLTFDPALAQRIYAGADLFLMPSRFEPCGLGQLISLRYGTIPIVRATGGLADTVEDYNPKTRAGTGFVFRSYNALALAVALARALEVYCQPDVWAALVARAMQQDVSWTSSAVQYVTVYARARATHRQRLEDS